MHISRRAILLAPLPLMLAFAACGDATQSQQPFAPASDRPTFIFFYAQG